MAMPKTFAHRGLQFSQGRFHRLSRVGEIHLQRSTRLGADEILIALRASAREVPAIDWKSAVGAIHEFATVILIEKWLRRSQRVNVNEITDCASEGLIFNELLIDLLLIGQVAPLKVPGESIAGGIARAEADLLRFFFICAICVICGQILLFAFQLPNSA